MENSYNWYAKPVFKCTINIYSFKSSTINEELAASFTRGSLILILQYRDCFLNTARSKQDSKQL